MEQKPEFFKEACVLCTERKNQVSVTDEASKQKK